MRQARVRTESMAQRLAKKPISEGFELWDKGYVFGAMRLFIFKAETMPPFQLGPCLDAVGHLCAQLEEYPDAKENYEFAKEKYELIQQPILAQLMDIKAKEVTDGPEAALKELDALLHEKDPSREADKLPEGKIRSALARVYYYRSELLETIGKEEDFPEALRDAQLGVELGWDRAHVGLVSLAKLLTAKGQIDEAIAALEKCVERNANYLAAYQLLGTLLRQHKAPLGLGRATEVFKKAIELNPRASLIRELAFTLSEMQRDNEAIEVLDTYIANPPHEEAEITAMAESTLAVFHKSKAAILADLGKKKEAIEELNLALKCAPRDEEAARMLEDVAELTSPKKAEE